MAEIEFIYAVIATAVKETVEFEERYWSRVPEKAIVPALKSVQWMLVAKAWDVAAKNFQKQQDPEPESLTAENVVLDLMKLGVPREKMRFRKGSFQIRLDNHEYRIYKRSAGCDVIPWPRNSNAALLYRKGAAEFILQFDQWIPTILEAAPEAFNILQKDAAAFQQRIMERRLREQTVQSLIGQFLLPLGIEAKYCFRGEDVIMDLQQVRTAHLEIPLVQLAEKLDDIESSLHAEIPSKAEEEFMIQL